MDNIKALAQLSGSENVAETIKGVKDAKKRLDALFAKIKESERAIAEAAAAQAEAAAAEQSAAVAGHSAAAGSADTAAQAAPDSVSPEVQAQPAPAAAPEPAAAQPLAKAQPAPAVQSEAAPSAPAQPVPATQAEAAPAVETQPAPAAAAESAAPAAETQPAPAEEKVPAEQPETAPVKEKKPKKAEVSPEASPKPAPAPAPAPAAVSATEPVPTPPAEGKKDDHRAKTKKSKAPETGIVTPIRKLSLEELDAINRPRQKSSEGNIKRSFINNPPARGPRDSTPRPPREGGAAPRPFGARPGGGGRPFGRTAETASAIPVSTGPSKSFGNKKKTPDKTASFEDKKAQNKRSLIKKGLIQTAIFDDDRVSRKYKAKKSKQQLEEERIKIEHAVVNTDMIPLKVLSEKLGISATAITKKLFKDGIIKTINETLDFDTAAMLALELGIDLELKLDKTAEELLSEFHVVESESDERMVQRPPVITVMGHVDHGKTSLLDAIKKTNVVTGEAGGITQHIGAYTVKMKGEPITFIDTPGHEAFTAMRARGASVTDVAVLVVAADDGVMPQTVEAINHIKAANVPMVVAINKMDKPEAKPDRIMQQLTEYEVLPEQWGGDTIMVPVSAHTGEGIDTLLETLLLVSDVRGLKANPDRKAKGTIIEAKLDKGKGPVATVLVQNGTLRVGDTIIAGTATGRIRAMLDDKGKSVKEAGPSYAVVVLGFSEVPSAGDPIMAVEDEKLSKQVLDERIAKIKQEMVQSSTQKVSLDDVFSRISEGQIKGLNLIVKADVQGSVEAVTQALVKLSNEEVKVNVIHGAAGAINESDVMLAGTASAVIIGFNVRPDVNARQVAERDGVEIKLYRVIYEAIDDVTAALKGMLAPKYKEVVLGQAQVRNVFKITGVGAVAGCYVTEGKIVRSAKIRIIRDNIVIFESTLSSLKRFKDDVKEVATGFECGMSVDRYNDIKEGDVLEAFIMEEIK